MPIDIIHDAQGNERRCGSLPRPVAVDDAVSKTGVYCILNTVNGKRYVGSASKSFNLRWGLHRRQLQTGKHHSRLLQRAWNKYGEESFVFRVLRVTEPGEAVEYEQSFIDLHKSADPKYGYNIAPIAGSSLGVKQSDDVRRALSERQTPEVRAIASVVQKRRLASPEARAELSARTKKYFESAENRHAVSVRQTERYKSQDARAATAESTRRQFATPESRARHSLLTKAQYASPEYRALHGQKVKNGRLKAKLHRAASCLVIIQ